MQDIEADSTPFIEAIPDPPTGLSPSEKAAFIKKKEEEFLHQGIQYLDQRASQPKIEVRILPSIRPKRPEQWSNEAWDNRIVIGNDDIHIFKGGSIPIPDSSEEAPLGWGDMFFLKVSSQLDSYGRSMYEDYDVNLETLSQLEAFAMQLRITYDAAKAFAVDGN